MCFEVQLADLELQLASKKQVQLEAIAFCINVEKSTLTCCFRGRDEERLHFCDEIGKKALMRFGNRNEEDRQPSRQMQQEARQAGS